MIEYENKKCRRCKYGDKNEYEKPCIIIREDCKLFEPITASEQMTTDEAKVQIECRKDFATLAQIEALDMGIKALDEVEKYKQIIEDIKDIFIDSLIFGELWDFKHDKISDDDVINEMNRVFKNEVVQAINKNLKGVSE